jgi:hypothetical protein
MVQNILSEPRNRHEIPCGKIERVLLLLVRRIEPAPRETACLGRK